MNNTEAGDPGWLGNPHRMDDSRDDLAERRRVIAAFIPDFIDRLESDPTFREAVEDLRGERVACWCRGISQERTESNWCHLDVVAAWLDGDLTPVYDYLRRAGDDQ
jgi:hypothetical protein